MSGNRAIVAGGTGLVGQSVIQYLSEDNFFSELYILNRRNVEYSHPKVHQILIDFENIGKAISDLKPTHAYCCLGTTIKQAGSKEQFRKVDYEYVLNFAKAVHALGCDNFNVVTAMGTNSDSLIFYNQVKYEVTKALEDIGFERLNILQPSLLLGNRTESRTGEGIAQSFFRITQKLWVGPLKNIAGIHGSQVAKAMVEISKDSTKGIYKFESKLLFDY